MQRKQFTNLRDLEQLSAVQQAEPEAALNEAPPTFAASAPDSQSIPEISVSELRHAVDAGVLQKRIGALLTQARAQAQLSGRRTAQRLKMNPAQLRKLEASDTNLEVSSLVRVAHELEFDVTIRLEPRGSGAVIETKL